MSSIRCSWAPLFVKPFSFSPTFVFCQRVFLHRDFVTVLIPVGVSNPLSTNMVVKSYPR